MKGIAFVVAAALSMAACVVMQCPAPDTHVPAPPPPPRCPVMECSPIIISTGTWWLSPNHGFEVNTGVIKAGNYTNP